MSWENISVMDLPQEEYTKKEFTPIPEGSYTLQLISAEPNRFREGAINITTAVAGENEHAGRKVFVDIPNPDEQAWAAPVLARLITAMGATMAPYSNPIDELNRIAQNGHSRFTASVYTEHYTKKNGEPGSKSKVNYRSISPAA